MRGRPKSRSRRSQSSRWWEARRSLCALAFVALAPACGQHARRRRTPRDRRPGWQRPEQQWWHVRWRERRGDGERRRVAPGAAARSPTPARPTRSCRSMVAPASTTQQPDGPQHGRRQRHVLRRGGGRRLQGGAFARSRACRPTTAARRGDALHRQRRRRRGRGEHPVSDRRPTPPSGVIERGDRAPRRQPRDVRPERQLWRRRLFAVTSPPPIRVSAPSTPTRSTARTAASRPARSTRCCMPIAPQASYAALAPPTASAILTAPVGSWTLTLNSLTAESGRARTARATSSTRRMAR